MATIWLRRLKLLNSAPLKIAVSPAAHSTIKLRLRNLLHIHGFLLALTLLTRLPVPNGLMPRSVDGTLKSLSVFYYPLVGVFIAAILIGVAKGLHQTAPDFFVAAIVLSVWVWLTGALHLEGLADSLDAWAASHKLSVTPRAILAVFKDPAAGPFAVVGIVLTLLLKVAALTALLSKGYVVAFLCAPVLARLAAVVVMASTPYVSAGGLASDTDISLKNKAAVVWCLSVLAGIGLYLGVMPLFLLVSVVSALTFLWRRFWLRTIEGYVGDCLGALIELVEVAVLVVFVFIFAKA